MTSQLNFNKAIKGSRKYSPIWEKIKSDGECSVSCPPGDVLAIIKGVRREKDLEKNSEFKRKILNPDVTSNGVTFKISTDMSFKNFNP